MRLSAALADDGGNLQAAAAPMTQLTLFPELISRPLRSGIIDHHRRSFYNKGDWFSSRGTNLHVRISFVRLSDTSHSSMQCVQTECTAVLMMYLRPGQ